MLLNLHSYITRSTAMIRVIILTLILLLAWARAPLIWAAPSPNASIMQAEIQPDIKRSRPKIGLVLGGGGAKGLAHIGVIKALEENHIPIDVIAGTSMGAIVGSLYASGYSADELLEINETLDWVNIFDDKVSRGRSTFRRKSDEYGFLTDFKIAFKDGNIVLPEGLIQGQTLFLELSNLLSKTRSIGSFEDLPIPFRLVATNLEDGSPEVMTKGDLATAVFASMAIPGLIPPVERDDKRLIDGGLVNNVPVNLARQLGADVVIVVNVGTDAKPASEISNFIDVLRQTQILLTQSNTQFQLGTLNSNDVLITPDLGALGAGSFTHSTEIVEAGYQSALLHMPQYKSFQLNDYQWQNHLAGRRAAPPQTPMIDRVEVEQNTRLSDEIIKVGISQKIGQPLDATALNSDIDKLYAQGTFDRITYRVEERMIDGSPQSALKISASTRESADGYFNFGLALDSNLENESDFKLGVAYTKPQINRWGGEWRSEVNIGDTLEGVSEFYQPIGARQKFFIEPAIVFSRDRDDYFDDEDRRKGHLRSFSYAGAVQAGTLFGRWGEVRVGASLGRVEFSFTDPELKDNTIKLKDFAYNAEFSIDTLDTLSFPTDGQIFVVNHTRHTKGLGGNFKFTQTDIQGFKPFTQGRHTFGVGTRLIGSSGESAGLLGSAELGGFLSLSGFSEDEISDQYAGMILGTYYYRLNRKAPLFDAPVFLGGSIEMGNTYGSLDDVGLDNMIYAASLFAGVKSPLGPIFIGIGHNDTDATSLYFSIGSFF